MGSKRMRAVALVIVALLACMSAIATTEAGQEITLIIRGSVQLVMRLIPAGSFIMGSPENEADRNSDEGPLHSVYISKPFYMGIYEVTQAQWAAVMQTYPVQTGYSPNAPVANVSWDDCQEFIRKLNNMGLGTFRLPTEAEWEYACRARNAARFPWWDDLDYSLIEQYAWYGGNSGRKAHPVGQKKPNAWGLYDMCGNVGEWCSDYYGRYSWDAQTDPRGPGGGPDRVFRSGCWSSHPRYLRSANRNYWPPSQTLPYLGLRLVMIVS